MKCIKCKEEAEWDFGNEAYCQEHWEEECNRLFWATGGGLYEEPRTDDSIAVEVATHQGNWERW